VQFAEGEVSSSLDRPAMHFTVLKYREWHMNYSRTTMCAAGVRAGTPRSCLPRCARSRLSAPPRASQSLGCPGKCPGACPQELVQRVRQYAGTGRADVACARSAIAGAYRSLAWQLLRSPHGDRAHSRPIVDGIDGVAALPEHATGRPVAAPAPSNRAPQASNRRPRRPQCPRHPMPTAAFASVNG
jgi:hypothetical protein